MGLVLSEEANRAYYERRKDSSAEGDQKEQEVPKEPKKEKDGRKIKFKNKEEHSKASVELSLTPEQELSCSVFEPVEFEYCSYRFHS